MPYFHGHITLAQTVIPSENEQFYCPTYLPIATPLLPSLTPGEAFMWWKELGAAVD